MTIFRYNLGSLVLALLTGCSSKIDDEPVVIYDQLGTGPIAEIIGANLAADDLENKLESYVQDNKLDHDEIRAKLTEAGFIAYDKSRECESMGLRLPNNAHVKNGSTMVIATWCVGKRSSDFEVQSLGVPQA
jgi:hypothetical protein